MINYKHFVQNKLKFDFICTKHKKSLFKKLKNEEKEY
jgi:hypothetical protein